MKKNQNLLLLYFATLALVFSSCSYSSYIPVTVYEPLLKEKGERQGVVYFGANHIELQGAYAITRHFAVQGDIWKGSDKRYSMDILPGYYYHSNGGFCVGVYAGAGMANTSGNKEISYSNILSRVSEKHINEVRYTSLIIQPGIGYRHDIFEIGFSNRISYVDFSQYHVQFYSKDLNYDRDYKLKDEYHSDGFSTWVFQPAINVSVGFKNVKAFFSTSLNVASEVKTEKYINYRHPFFQSVLFSSGLKVDLMAPKKFKKKAHIEF